MRCIGYPPEKISILTAYNGQKNLLEDIFRHRCATNPLLTMPATITTIDKFQGRQNDFIILSLVRTKSVGYLQDFRRIIVAVSRARLGLYIVGREAIFRNCKSVAKSFKPLFAKPTRLELLPDEYYGTCSRQVSIDLNSSSSKNNQQILSFSDGNVEELSTFVQNLYLEKVQNHF